MQPSNCASIFVENVCQDCVSRVLTKEHNYFQIYINLYESSVSNSNTMGCICMKANKEIMNQCNCEFLQTSSSSKSFMYLSNPKNRKMSPTLFISLCVFEALLQDGSCLKDVDSPESLKKKVF